MYTLPKNFNFAKFNILRNFIDAAAMAGIVAGVQVTMLLDLATKLCDTGGWRHRQRSLCAAAVWRSMLGGLYLVCQGASHPDVTQPSAGP
jgi:hypothetical protein